MNGVDSISPALGGRAAQPAAAARVRDFPGLSGAAAAPAAGARAAQGGYRVVAGDTLIDIVRRHLAARGASASAAELLESARELARANRIEDPDLIFPGTLLSLDVLEGRLRAAARSVGPGASAAGPRSSPVAPAVPATPAAAPVAGMLDRTLDRAVDKGYIPASQREAVRARVEAMADRFGFSPDHFAMVALMESDGFDPRATNGACHGIIQFCGGSGRGAASVGYAGRPEAIRSLGVLDQLSLVERYLEDVGLQRGDAAGLSGLYLSVLTPAAMSERHPDRPLDVAGPQAAALHVGGDRQAPITRRSLEAGLLRHALRLVGDTPGGRPDPASRAQARAPLAAREPSAVRGVPVAQEPSALREASALPQHPAAPARPAAGRRYGLFS